MKILKITGAVLAALVVLVLVAGSAVALLFDPNDYKDEVAAAFEQRTGRALVIEDDFALGYFPWLAVETGGIRIGNAAGFGDEAFATVEGAAARIRLLPLIKRRFELGTIELDGLTLNLARAGERSNWDDLVAAFAADESDPASAGAGAGAEGGLDGERDSELGGERDGEVDVRDAAADAPAASRVALAGIRITDGSVRFSESGALAYAVEGLDLATGTIAAGEPVAVALAGRFRAAQSGAEMDAEIEGLAALESEGRIAARDLTARVVLAAPATGGAPRALDVRLASLLYDPAATRLEFADLALEAPGMRAAASGSATQLRTAPAVEARLELRAASMADLLNAVDWPLPANTTPADLGPVAVDAGLAYETATQTLRIADIDAEVLGFALRGAALLTGNEVLSGEISIPEFATSPTLRALLASAVPPTVDVDALERLGLTTRFEADLGTGSAALRGLSAQVLGATITGELEAVPGERGNVFRGSITTTRFSAAPLTRAFRALLPPAIEADEIGNLELDTRFVFDTAADTVAFAPFAAEAFGLRGNGELRGGQVSSAASWTGRLSIAQFSPQALMTRFGLPPPATSDPRALTAATIDTRIAVTAGGGRFEGIVLVLDDSRITGDFTVERFDDPSYAFTLAVDRVDADRYLPPTARDAQAADGERRAGEIELPTNNTMQLDGAITVGALALAGMQFADVGTRIVIGEGNARLEDARARLYGGEFNGSFAVQAAGDAPGLALRGTASSVELAPLIEALTGESANVSGTGNFDIDLAGQGRRVIDNVATASGTVGFAMSAGAIRGFNLGRTLCAAYNLTQRAAAPPELPKETSYELIQGTAAVVNGVASSTDLLARTDFMDIAGAGSLALAEQRLNYDVDATLTGPIAIPNCSTMDSLVGQSIPFDIRGTVTDPAITPDFSKIVQRAIRENVQERARDLLEDRLRELLR